MSNLCYALDMDGCRYSLNYSMIMTSWCVSSFVVVVVDFGRTFNQFPGPFGAYFGLDLSANGFGYLVKVTDGRNVAFHSCIQLLYGMTVSFFRLTQEL